MSTDDIVAVKNWPDKCLIECIVRKFVDSQWTYTFLWDLMYQVTWWHKLSTLRLRGLACRLVENWTSVDCKPGFSGIYVGGRIRQYSKSGWIQDLVVNGGGETGFDGVWSTAAQTGVCSICREASLSPRCIPLTLVQVSTCVCVAHHPTAVFAEWWAKQRGTRRSLWSRTIS